MQPVDMVQEFLEFVRLPVHSKDERKIADVVKAKLVPCNNNIFA